MATLTDLVKVEVEAGDSCRSSKVTFKHGGVRPGQYAEIDLSKGWMVFFIAAVYFTVSPDKTGKYEAIEVIEDWGLGFNLGNTVKYISRAGHKDNILQDLKKALWYLDREIKRIEKE